MASFKNRSDVSKGFFGSKNRFHVPEGFYRIEAFAETGEDEILDRRGFEREELR